MHLLCRCEHAKSFWLSVNRAFKDSVDIELAFTDANIIYNLVHPKPGHIMNFIVLLGKFHIYRNKINKCTANYTEFHCEIKFIEQIERYNAQVNNNAHRHHSKWKPIIREL